MPQHKHNYYLYIIQCQDGTYYTGTTSNMELRWKQHCEGAGADYTKKHMPHAVVYVKEFRDIYEAREREKQIGNWSQLKKKKLISGEWE